MTKKEQFLNWLRENSGSIDAAPELFLSTIADKAEEIYRPTFSVQIQQIDLPDHEYYGEGYEPKKKSDFDNMATATYAWLKANPGYHPQEKIAEGVGVSIRTLSARFSDIKKLGWGKVDRRPISKHKSVYGLIDWQPDFFPTKKGRHTEVTA